MATTYTQRTYTQSEKAQSLLKELEAHLAAKPEAYSSQWLTQLDDVLGQILNRPSFSYDANTDPLYNQYRDSYVNHGRLAMMDTLGQAATLTGGYGNSYAEIAGQQIYQGYLQGLNDVIPELYQLALETYDRENQSLLDRYGAIADREALDYGRYTDNYGLWADQRDYLSSQYDSERGFDYTQFRDLVEDDQWIAQFEEDIRRYEEKKAAASSRGSGSGSGGSRRKKDDDDEEASGSVPSGSGNVTYADRVKHNLYTNSMY